MSTRPSRIGLGFAVALLLSLSQVTGALAVTTGAISGTVTDAASNAPISGAAVAAVSPSGTYRATTNARGFFVLVGVSPDTYTLTISKAGYQPQSLAGVTVSQGNNVVENVRLGKEVRTIGQVSVRGQTTSLVQPNVTTDSYSVDTQQQDTLKGTPLSSEQFGLLNELPGVSNANGYPLLRGGLENNEGYQVEGITVTDPFYNQFANNDTFNGARDIKVVLGPGDATQGGAGSGYINEVVKQGAYPAFGIFQTEFGWQVRQNNLNFEYGNATPDNRFSYFISGRYQPNQTGIDAPNANGPYRPNQVVQGVALNDTLGQGSAFTGADTLVNLYYKLGRNNRDQIQFYDEKGLQNYQGNYGLFTPATRYYAYDPFYAGAIYAPLTPAQLPVFPGQNPNQIYPNQPGQIQTYDLTKLAFSHTFNSSTFLNARLFRLNGNTEFNLTESNYPYIGYGYPSLFNDFYEATPFQTTGAAFDLQKQLGDKHFVSLGGEYKFSNGHLLIGYPPSLAFLFLPNEINDFIPGGGGQFDPAVTGKNIRLPLPEYGTLDPEYSSAAYITDQFKPTDRITLQPGLRFEKQRIHLPAGLYDVNALAPKLGATYALGANKDTVLRATYGHSTVFAPLGQVEYIYQAPTLFHNYPATASNCGGYQTNFSSPCKDYYDQIVNDFAANIGYNPSSFPQAQKSDSYDASLEHRYANNVSLKLTSYYRRDYDVVTQVALPININGTLVNGPTSVTNLGNGRTFGIDMGLSREVPQGLGGQFNLTYINQFINYLSNGAFIPDVNPATLQTLVHPPYLSPFDATLALDYRRNGWRVNPILTYAKGNPQGFPQSFYVTQPNGLYEAVPNTNYFGNPNTPCYFVDPQVPGTSAAPNIVGSLGGGCAKARNSTLSPANIFGYLTVSKDITRRSTVGFTIYNLFDNRTQGLYEQLAGGTGAYVNNGFGAYGAGSGFSQYGNGFIAGAPNAFPNGPFFNTESGPGRYGVFFVNVKI